MPGYSSIWARNASLRRLAPGSTSSSVFCFRNLTFGIERLSSVEMRDEILTCLRLPPDLFVLGHALVRRGSQGGEAEHLADLGFQDPLAAPTAVPEEDTVLGVDQEVERRRFEGVVLKTFRPESHQDREGELVLGAPLRDQDRKSV